MNNKFFGSKLNSILLLVLIILMIIALCVMFNDKEKYLGAIPKQAPVISTEQEPIPAEIKNQILGNKDDLVSFSIWPNTKVSGVLSYRGVIKGAYFSEGSFLVKILDINKKVLKTSNAISKSEWMTVGPVNFEGNIDFTDLTKGPAYFGLFQDDPSDGESGRPIKNILIPIIIQ